MAHQIETHKGKAAFVTANIPAWHQLGTVLDGAFTAEQAMELGRLGGWNVRKSPLFVAETGRPAEGAYATIRDSPFEPGQTDVLGVVGETYHPVQNEEMADILNILVDESGAVFDTAGSLRGGAQTFVTMKLPGHMLIGGVDAHEMHVAAVNSHDGNSAFSLLVTPVRIVCANTLSAALGGARNTIRLRHTQGLRRNLIDDARRALDMTFDYLDAFQAEADQMINTQLTLDRFEEIVANEFGTTSEVPHVAAKARNKIEDLCSLFADAQTHEQVRGTVWAGFNAFVEYADHYSEVRGHLENRARSAALGSDFKVKARKLMIAEL